MRRKTDDDQEVLNDGEHDDDSDTQRNIRENQEGKPLFRTSDQVIFPGDIAEVSFYPNGLIETITYRSNEQNAAAGKKSASLSKTLSKPWGKNFWQSLNERAMEKVKQVNARVNQKLSALGKTLSQPRGKNFWQLLNERAMEKEKLVNAIINKKLSCTSRQLLNAKASRKNFWQLMNERAMEKVKRVNARVNQKLSTLRQLLNARDSYGR